MVIPHAKNQMATANHITGFFVLNKNYSYRPQSLQADRIHVGDDWAVQRTLGNKNPARKTIEWWLMMHPHYPPFPFPFLPTLCSPRAALTEASPRAARRIFAEVSASGNLSYPVFSSFCNFSSSFLLSPTPPAAQSHPPASPPHYHLPE